MTEEIEMPVVTPICEGVALLNVKFDTDAFGAGQRRR